MLTVAAAPGAGYKVRFFQSGTTTPVTVYTSPNLATPHDSPLVSDAAGVFPPVFSGGGAVKSVVTKPDDSSYYTLDPVFRIPTSASGATEVTFNPTVALPFENVQDAIEGAAASAASGFTPFGLGVTGTNALIADLNATNVASGTYRFDNTTIGTFPTGVVASDTGTVILARENSGDAVIWLQSGAADRQFTRRLASSTWGAWREVITVDQGAAQGDTIFRGASAWTRLAKGTAGQGLRINAGATAPEWGSLIATQTAVTPTGVTFVDLTGIPATAQRVTVMLLDLSLTGTDSVAFQLGTTASVETTGYGGATSFSAPGNSAGSSSHTSAFFINIGANNNNGAIRSGAVVFQKMTGNSWMATGNFSAAAPIGCFFSGVKTLADVLTRVRVLATGANTIDGGTIVISWE